MRKRHVSDESAQGVLPDISGFPGDLYFRHERFTAAHWPTHAHAWGQLNYLSRGVMHIEIDGQRYLSPPQYALWIPPHTGHVSYTHGETIYRSVYVSLACSARMRDRTACGRRHSAAHRQYARVRHEFGLHRDVQKGRRDNAGAVSKERG
jgi:hypothetical protein